MSTTVKITKEGFIGNLEGQASAWGGEESLRETLRGEVLFSSGIATFGDITIDGDFKDYAYIDIEIGTDDDHRSFQRVFEPDGKIVGFSVNLCGQANFFAKCRTVKLEGSTVSTATIAGTGDNAGTQVVMAGLWSTNNPYGWERTEKYIGICKIVGYRAP